MKKFFIYFIVNLDFSLTAFSQNDAKPQPEKDWHYSASAYYYFVPGDKNSVSITSYADYKKLHLEGRYNYEDRNTGSVFVGWTFEKNGNVYFAATPMIGGVFGNTNGVAPGLELELSYKKFEYSSETEYVIDFSGSENNFFYAWGEFGFNATNNLQLGLSYQKTKLYQAEFNIQRGPFVKYSFWKLTAGVYYFNPFASDGLAIGMVTIDF
ncbi:MAG: hypothetical protein C5B52_10985 [Bacteroidetes bacterium]|nr:MAG: hypothetical protein C5B52_10985 [Bacteroidota bacterium]